MANDSRGLTLGDIEILEINWISDVDNLFLWTLSSTGDSIPYSVKVYPSNPNIDVQRQIFIPRSWLP